MTYHVSSRNVIELIDRAAVSGLQGPRRDPGIRHTFDEHDPDRITGALGWVLAEAGLEKSCRRTVASLSDLPYNLWPAIEVDGVRLFEPDMFVLRALEAACRSDPETASDQARAAAGALR
jgi:hypothetical protein